MCLCAQQTDPQAPLLLNKVHTIKGNENSKEQESHFRCTADSQLVG